MSPEIRVFPAVFLIRQKVKGNEVLREVKPPEFGEFNAALPKHSSRIRGRTQIKNTVATRRKPYSAVSLSRFSSCTASPGALTDEYWEIGKP